MNPDHFSIILVEPQGPINIGAVCRTMMNFGFTRLRLVNPCRHYQSLIARKMAMTAITVLENALLFDTLPEALQDIHVAFGTTRRFGKYRKTFFTPEAAAAKLHDNHRSNECALVLGPEDTGLKTRDLDLCQHFITIPTHDLYPSMNLSHALAILLYEISTGPGNREVKPPAEKKPASGHEIEQMYAHMKKTLTDIEFLDRQNPDHLLRTFRRIFGTAGLSSREVKILRGLMSRIDWIDKERLKK